MLTFDLFTSKVEFASPFVWTIYIYIESMEVTCRSTVVKIVLIGNLRWPSSGLYLLYFPATVLFTCIKLWFFRNHFANFHQISHWSFCWNVIDSLFKWSCSIDFQAHIFFFKTKNCSNNDIFISCDDRIGKMLHNICSVCSGYVTQVSEPWPVGLLFLFSSDNRIWHFMQIVSIGDNLHEIHFAWNVNSYFSGKNKQKYFNMLSAKYFTQC